MSRNAVDSPVYPIEARYFCASILVFWVFTVVWNAAIAAQEPKSSPSSTSAVDLGFDVVADIFEARCITCHNGS